MTGTIINVGAILAGGAAGLTLGRDLSAKAQHRLKLFLGILTIYAGMSMAWQAVGGSFFTVMKQLFIMFLALILGNVIGKALGLQNQVNRLGEMAKAKFDQEDKPGSRFSEGFVTCTILFCVGPMALLGALQDGLKGEYRLLAIKAVMDGLATLAFSKTFGWGVMMAAIPVLAYQGTITLAASRIAPYLANEEIVNSINGTGGLLVLCISVVILELQKVPLADYLPSLAVAPLLTWLWP